MKAERLCRGNCVLMIIVCSTDFFRQTVKSRLEGRGFTVHTVLLGL